MKSALAEGKEIAPSKGARGTCAECGRPVIARNGPYSTPHFSHLPRYKWDKWWETETEWHCAWKRHFPEDWREITIFGPEMRERHVADVKTSAKIVIEFQRKPIPIQEIRTREEFYGNMVWVVDACLGKNAIVFARTATHPCDVEATGLWLEDRAFGFATYPEPPIYEPSAWDFSWSLSRSSFFNIWSQATKRVFLDFGHMGFWWLYSFDPKERNGKAFKVHPENFLNWLGGDPSASSRIRQIDFAEVGYDARLAYDNSPSSVRVPRDK